jgi:hypothetical protein
MNELATLDEQAVCALPPPKRGQILAFQSALEDLPQVECPLTHTFAPGMYAREISLPAGTFIVGKIHKHAHLNIVTKGRVTVVTEFGRREIRVTGAPITFTSDAGSKRALYVHEDAIWITIHAVQSTDLAEIEREIIAPDFEELDAFLARARAELQSPHTGDARVIPSPGSRLQLEPEH